MPKLNDTDLLKRAKANKRLSDDKHAKWKKLAKIWYEFAAGGHDEDTGQWDKETLNKLKVQGRPPVTFNTIEKVIEGLTGTEVNNRESIDYQPRDEDDTVAADSYNTVGKYARDNDVEEEDTQALRDTFICGLGWTDSTMMYDQDPDGRFSVVAEEPMSMSWDPRAKRPGLTDARWVGRVKRIAKDEFDSLWPEKVSKGHTSVFGDDGRTTFSHGEPEQKDSDYDHDIGEIATADDDVAVFEYQYFSMVPLFRFTDPITGNDVKTDQAGFKEIKGILEPQGFHFTPAPAPREAELDPARVLFVKQDIRRYYRAFFTGDSEILEHEESMWPFGFTLQAVTGRYDRVNKLWYGAVRAMMDPQRWGNKFLSQWIHQFNSNIKGGGMYEETAMDNPDDWTSEVSQTSPWLKVNDGAISGGKIQFFTPSIAPPDIQALMQFAFGAPASIIGYADEFFGVAGRDQPIGLEQTRKLATMSIVAPIFSSYRKYRKVHGRLLLYFMWAYFTDETITRVLPKALKEEGLAAIKNTDIAKFDIHVDDAPLSPSMKATTFSVMKDFIQFLPPEVQLRTLPAFLKSSPLPGTVVRELVQQFEAAQQPDPLAKLEREAKLTIDVATAFQKMAKGYLDQAKTDAVGEGIEQTSLEGLLDFVSKQADIDVKMADAEVKQEAAEDRRQN